MMPFGPTTFQGINLPIRVGEVWRHILLGNLQFAEITIDRLIFASNGFKLINQ